MSELATIKSEFIKHWGEMGSRWGIEREVAEVHALLYTARKPLTMDELIAELKYPKEVIEKGVSELLSWGLAYKEGEGSIRAELDVITMLKLIAEERRKRELDPTLEMLKGMLDKITPLPPSEEKAGMEKGVFEMLDFLQSVSSLYDRGKKLPLPLIKKVIKLDKQLEKLLNFL